MNLNDLDDDELACLAQWLVANSPQTIVDLRNAPAWRFAHARLAVDAGDLAEFPNISYDGSGTDEVEPRRRPP